MGIDIQIHKEVNYERMLERMVPGNMIREILEADDPVRAFYAQWVLREAYIKWTGEGAVQRSPYHSHGQRIQPDAGNGGRIQRSRVVSGSDGASVGTHRLKLP